MDEPCGGAGGVDPIERLTAVSDADEERAQHVSDADELRALRRSVTTNRDVASALGILMERRDLDVDEAFGVLLQVCRQHRRRLSEVAAELVATRTVAGSEELTGSRARPADPE